MIRRFGAPTTLRGVIQIRHTKRVQVCGLKERFINKSVIEFRRFFKFLKWKHAS
jgi:hypothetical protein